MLDSEYSETKHNTMQNVTVLYSMIHKHCTKVTHVSYRATITIQHVIRTEVLEYESDCLYERKCSRRWTDHQKVILKH